MSISGIQSIAFGVEDLETCTEFLLDFGLVAAGSTADERRFVLEDGTTITLKRGDDPSLPASSLVGYGARGVIWGVETQADLEALVAKVQKRVEVRRDSDGTAHFLTPCGLPMGLKQFTFRQLTSTPDPLNAPGHVGRVNRPRRWKVRARPRAINHIVFAVPDVNETFAFLRDALDFRLSDVQQGYGLYARAKGSMNHHNIFLMNAHLPIPGMDGNARYHHTNFAVEDIDEIMIGANHMTRRGWPNSELGLGRHRLDSALFFYLPSPLGGEIEYGADGDLIDDSWVPRDWVEPTFGYITWVHDLPPFLLPEPAWKVTYLEGTTPGSSS